MYGGIKKGKIYRVLEVPSSLSLYKFAELIVDAFNFDFDHLFGFYNEKVYSKTTVGFELIEDDFFYFGSSRDFKVYDVKKTTVEFLFTTIGKKVYFLFDFGDNWWFELKLQGVHERKKGVFYPVITKAVGKSPVQYPELEEELEEDEEIEVTDYDREKFTEKISNFLFDTAVNTKKNEFHGTHYDEGKEVYESKGPLLGDSIINFFIDKLNIDESIVKSAIDEIKSFWEVYYEDAINGISLDRLGDFAHDLLVRYPENVDVMLFVLSLGFKLLHLAPQDLALQQNPRFIFVGIIEFLYKRQKKRFPVFRLLNILIQNREKLSPKVSDDLIDVIALQFLSTYKDSDLDLQMALKYFEHTFSQGINISNSLSFLITCGLYTEFFKSWATAKKFINKLLTYFKDNKKVKNWLIHLGIGLVLYYLIKGNINSLIRKSLLENQVYTLILKESLILPTDVITTALKRNTRIKYTTQMGFSLQAVALELNKLIGESEKEPEFIDGLEVIRTIFHKLYIFLFDEEYPVTDEFITYIYLSLKDQFLYNSLSYLLDESLTHLTLKDKKKMGRFLDTLYNILSSHREVFDELELSLLNPILKAFVYHKDTLGLDFVVNKLEKMKKDNLANIRLNTYKHLYAITGDKKYLEDAINDASSQVSRWAQKQLKKVQDSS